MKIGALGAELFVVDRRKDGRTDRHDETDGIFYVRHSTEPNCKQQFFNFCYFIRFFISLFNLEF